MMKVAAALLLALACIAAPASAQEPGDSFRIALQVSVPDDDLRDRTTKYLQAELQQISDVIVTDDDPDFKLYAVVTQVRTSANTRMAYVLAVSIASFFPDRYLNHILDDRIVNIDDVRKNMSTATIYENQFVSLAGPTEQNLQEVVRNAVKKFDRHMLRIERNSRQAAAEPKS